MGVLYLVGCRAMPRSVRCLRVCHTHDFQVSNVHRWIPLLGNTPSACDTLRALQQARDMLFTTFERETR